MNHTQRPLHIVQIGSDSSVFSQTAPSDTFRRQVEYSLELNRIRPGSQLTLLVLVTHQDYQPRTQESVIFIPVYGRGKTIYVRLLMHILRLHRKQPIDVISPQTIFTDALSAFLASWLTRSRVVGQIHFDIFSPEAMTENIGTGVKARLRRWLAFRLLSHYYAVRVVGKRLKDRLIAQRLCQADRVSVIPVAVTIPPSSERSNQPDSPVVLFVGRLVEAKNLYCWLRVVKQVSEAVPQATFILAGDGPLYADLQHYARQLNLFEKTQFPGMVNYEDLPAIYAKASVFLLTSHYEGFGRVLVEAALNQLPSVAPRITGVEDIIRDGETGYLHDANDEKGMADSLIQLLNNPPLAMQMGKTAQTWVREAFAPQDFIRQWVNLLIAAGDPNPQ